MSNIPCVECENSYCDRIFWMWQTIWPHINIYNFCLYTSLPKPHSATKWENPKCSVFTGETTWRYGFLPTRIFAQTFSKNKVHKKEQQKKQQVSKFQYPTWTACRHACYITLWDLHSTLHMCAWGTTRRVNHTSFNIVHASIPKLWASLSYWKMQDGRWLPNHITYRAPDRLVHGGPQDHSTMYVWALCRQVFLSYEPHWATQKSSMAAKLLGLYSTQHTCAWGTTIRVYHASFNIVCASIPELWASLSWCQTQNGCQTAWPTDHLTHPCMGGGVTRLLHHATL